MSAPRTSGDLQTFIEAMRKVPPESEKEVKKTIRSEGMTLRDTARSNAAWSSRIPAAISMRTRGTGRSPGVYVQVAAKVAPHGRSYEGITGKGSFRHPVYGHGKRRNWTWVAQSTRPYLAKALALREKPAADAVEKAVNTALRNSGFR